MVPRYIKTIQFNLCISQDGMSECLSDLTQLMAWAIEGVLPRIRVDHGATKTGQKRGLAESTSDFAFGLIQVTKGSMLLNNLWANIGVMFYH